MGESNVGVWSGAYQYAYGCFAGEGGLLPIKPLVFPKEGKPDRPRRPATHAAYISGCSSLVLYEVW